MITETILLILLTVAIASIFLTFQYQSIMSGALASLLLILVGSYFLIGGISQETGITTTQQQSSSSVVVLGITTTNTTITGSEVKTFTTEKNVPLGLLFLVIGSFLIWEVYRFRKQTKEATHDRL